MAAQPLERRHDVVRRELASGGERHGGPEMKESASARAEEKEGDEGGPVSTPHDSASIRPPLGGAQRAAGAGLPSASCARAIASQVSGLTAFSASADDSCQSFS